MSSLNFNSSSSSSYSNTQPMYNTVLDDDEISTGRLTLPLHSELQPSSISSRSTPLTSVSPVFDTTGEDGEEHEEDEEDEDQVEEEIYINSESIRSSNGRNGSILPSKTGMKQPLLVHSHTDSMVTPKSYSSLTSSHHNGKSSPRITTIRTASPSSSSKSLTSSPILSSSHKYQSEPTLVSSIPSVPSSPSITLSTPQSFIRRRLRKIVYCSTANLTIMICSLILCISLWIGSNILWLYVSVGFSTNGGFFNDQVTTALFVSYQAPIVLYRLCTHKFSWKHNLKWYSIVIIGTLDACYYLFTTMGSVYTNGAFQVLIFQMPIPIAMCISYFVLNARYYRGQYIGAVTMLVGGCMAVLPTLIPGKT